MKIIASEPYTVNGFKYRNLYRELPNGHLDPIGDEVFTPHCDWVTDGSDPSFECKRCDESCPEHKKWMDFYEEEGYL